MERDKQGFFKETSILAEDYIKERLLLVKLQTAEKTAKLVSAVFTGFIIVILCFFILLFLSFMAGYYVQEITGNWYYAFGIVTGFYILLVAFLVYFRKILLYKFIANSVIRILFENNEEIGDDQKVQ